MIVWYDFPAVRKCMNYKVSLSVATRIYHLKLRTFLFRESLQLERSQKSISASFLFFFPITILKRYFLKLFQPFPKAFLAPLLPLFQIYYIYQGRKQLPERREAKLAFSKSRWVKTCQNHSFCTTKVIFLQKLGGNCLP